MTEMWEIVTPLLNFNLFNLVGTLHEINVTGFEKKTWTLQCFIFGVLWLGHVVLHFE